MRVRRPCPGVPAFKIGLDEIAERFRPGRGVAQFVFMPGLQRFQRDEAAAQGARAQRLDARRGGAQGTSFAIQFGNAKAAAWISGL